MHRFVINNIVIALYKSNHIIIIIKNASSCSYNMMKMVHLINYVDYVDE